MVVGRILTKRVGFAPVRKVPEGGRGQRRVTCSGEAILHSGEWSAGIRAERARKREARSAGTLA